MDLIEKLGGYEKAKGVFSRMSVCQRGCIEDKLVFFSFAGLQKALLEYRREHKIYEVGDKVVTLPDHNPYPFVLTVSEVGADGWFFASNDKYCNGAICRHATDEEIKVGYRL